MNARDEFRNLMLSMKMLEGLITAVAVNERRSA